MAYTPRTISQIQTQLIQQLSNYPLLAPLLPNTSKVAKFTNWTYIIAFCINALEQIWAILIAAIEATVSKGVPETSQWIQAQVLAFQYSATVPQVIQLNTDFSIGYPIVNPALRVVTNCAVVPAGGGITIKVAGASGLLSGPQIAALTSYLETVLGPDINFTLVNVLTDVLQINGTYYYNGQYNGSALNDITIAVNAYLAALPFNGTIKVSDLIDTIRNVVGITDFVPSQITVTAVVGAPINLVAGSQILVREYTTYSGSIQIDPANPLSSTLTPSISNN